MDLFYKFEPNGETFIPLTGKQRRICNTLNVPFSLWSFYTLKSKYIKEYWKDFIHIIPLIRGEEEEYSEEDEEVVTRFDYSDYEGLNLTWNEKFFIFHKDDILEMQREYVCVNYSPPSLKDICMNRRNLFNDPRIKDFLPKSLTQELFEKFDIQMPKYDCIGMRQTFFDKPFNLNDLFMKMDPICPKEFVVWFQNENLMTDILQMNSVKVISTLFYKDSIKKEYHICMNCLKLYLKDRKISGIFIRSYFLVMEDYLRGDMNLIAYVQNPLHWCHECKRVPLFHFMDYDEFEGQYGEWISRYPFKTDYYI